MATYYWVGGTAIWNNTNTAPWATTSGGTGGAGVPTSADTATFDANSGVCNVSIASTATCTTCNFGGAGVTATLNANRTTAFLSLNVSAGLFDTSTFNVTMSTVSVTGGNFLNTSGTKTIGQIASSGASSRSITLGSATYTMSGSTPINFSGTNLTFNAGGSQINSTSAAPTFTGNGETFNNVSFTNTALNTATINGANTFNNLTFASKAAVGVVVVLFASNQTINGTLTVPTPTTIGASRYFFRSDTIGTARTLTGNTSALTDVDFRDITHSGTTWTGNRLGDCGGNSGITFPAAKTVYWNLAGAQNYSATGWATTQTGAPANANFPLPQDTAVFTDANPAAGVTITLSGTYNIGALDFSTRTNTLTFATSTIPFTIYGNVTLSSIITLSGTGTITFAGRSTTQTITSAGVVWTQPITISAISSSIILGSALTSSNTLSLANGTLNLSGYTQTHTTVAVGPCTKNITFNGGSLICTSSTTTAFNNIGPTGFTTTAGTGVGSISMTGATAKTFVGGGSTYNCTLNQGGAGALTITGANTFNNITNTVQPATVTFPASTTNIFNNFSLSGTAGNLITINSSTAGTQATVSNASGTVTVSYCSIQDSNATGGATWNAFTSNGNVSAGNNLGWNFTGGTTYNVSLTEAAAAADAVSALLGSNTSLSEIGIADAIQDTANNTFNSQLIEAGTILDAQTVIATFNTVLAETGSAGDTETSALFQSSSVSENANAIESETATTIVVVTGSVEEPLLADDIETTSKIQVSDLTESITATDAEIATQTQESNITESVTATESQDALLSLLNYIVEAVVGADAQTNILYAGAQVTETVIASDTYDAAGSTYNTQITEVLTAQDIVNGILTITSILSESIVAAEAQTAVTSMLVTITESAIAAETQGALVNLVAYLVEAVIAIDGYDASGSVYNVTLNESGSAQSTLSAAGSTFNVALLESVIASDSYAGRLLWELINDIQNANWGNVSNSQNPVWSAINNAQNPSWVNVSDPQTPGWSNGTDSQNPNWTPINTFGTS